MHQPDTDKFEEHSANYKLTSAASGVMFDLDADGSPERCAWTEGDAEIAFLVLDRNGNGTIDDGSELFGSATRRSDGTRISNGFDALLDLEGGSTISDGRITSTDAVYWRLRLWLDRNHNGVSETDQLIALSDAGVIALYNAYQGTAFFWKPEGAVQRRLFHVYLTVIR